MTPITTVLLDLDGTLLDSAPGILACYRLMLQELGHTPDPAYDLTHVIGPPIATIMPHVLAHYNDTRTDLALATYRRHYGETGVYGATPYAGIPQMLETLRTAGRTLHVATAKRVDYARTMLEHLGLAHHFQSINGALPGGGLDTKTELIAHILTEQRIDPTQAAMAGDRRYDITGAQANHIRAYAVLWGYGTREELESAAPDALADTPAHLAALLT